MDTTTLTLTTEDGITVHVNRWLPPEGTTVRAVVQIAHGMAEHSQRYERFAQALTQVGFAVYAHDHRGHKMTAVTHDQSGYLADSGWWAHLVEDLGSVIALAREEQPGLPIILFGHSMGSFVSRAFAAERG